MGHQQGQVTGRAAGEVGAALADPHLVAEMHSARELEQQQLGKTCSKHRLQSRGSAALPPRLGFKEHSESLRDGRGSPGSGLRVWRRRMLEQKGETLGFFFGCGEACSMGKLILGTLLLLLSSQTHHPPSLELPLPAILGLAEALSAAFSSLSWDTLPWPLRN